MGEVISGAYPAPTEPKPSKSKDKAENDGE
jgi:hypothetical protein